VNQVIGRRQIEMYSRLIHTVDHVEGYLREGFDALDAFLAHSKRDMRTCPVVCLATCSQRYLMLTSSLAWAVTVTGAPKLWAMRFLEKVCTTFSATCRAHSTPQTHRGAIFG